MRRELHGLTDGVQDPAKDYLSGRPTAVSCAKFLEGDGFVAVAFGARLGKDSVDSFQQVAAQFAHSSRSPLANLDIVIHEDVGGPYRLPEGHVGRRSSNFDQRRSRSALGVRFKSLVGAGLLGLLLSGFPGV
jgi:hypothetical protein